MVSDNKNRGLKVTSASYAGHNKPIIRDENTVVENRFGYTLVWEDDPKNKEAVVKKTVGGRILVGFEEQ